MIKTLTKETIAVHWKEEELICPNEEFVRQANMSDLGAMPLAMTNKHPGGGTHFGDFIV